MQCAEYEVTRLGGGEREPDRFQIAHFADEDDIRVFAQRRAQRFGETQGVAMNLALVHQATLRLVHELDRILDRDDVVGAVVITVIHHAGERGGLAGARRARDEHEAAREHAQVAENLRCTQVIERENDRGNIRNTAPAPRFWLNALTRKRASLGISNEKSVSKNSSKALRCLSFMMSYTMLCTSLCTRAGML